MAENDLKQIIIAHIERGSTKEQIISDSIFAGFSYKDIMSTFAELDREGKMPADFLAGVRSRNSYIQHVSRLSDRIVPDQDPPTIGRRIALFFLSHRVLTFIIFCVVVIGIGSGLAWRSVVSNHPDRIVRNAFYKVLGSSSFEYALTFSGIPNQSHEESSSDFWGPFILSHHNPIVISLYGVVDSRQSFSSAASFVSQGDFGTSTSLWSGAVIYPSVSDRLFVRLADFQRISTSTDLLITQKALNRWVSLSSTTTASDVKYLMPSLLWRLFGVPVITSSYNKGIYAKSFSKIVYSGVNQEEGVDLLRYDVVLSSEWVDAFSSYCDVSVRLSSCSLLPTFLNSSKLSVLVVPSTGALYRVVLTPLSESWVVDDLSINSISFIIGNVNHQKIIEAPSPSFSLEQIKLFAEDQMYNN